MKEYVVTVPIVGYSYVTVTAENEEQAKEKALDLCCEFKDENVQVEELYGVEHVAEGCVVNHPCWDIEIEES